VDWPQTEKRLASIQLAVFLGQRYLVTCHPRKNACVEEVLKECEQGKDPMFGKGADFLLYEIMDNMAERYMHALDRLAEEAEHVEEQILADPQAHQREMHRITLLRKNVLRIRRMAGPQRDAINALARPGGPHVSEKARIYVRDVYDKMLRVSEMLDTYREVVTDLRDIHLAMVSNRMNEVIKVLTVITTILLPLTVISGIYGMNFKYMPELGLRYGYYAVLGVMVVTTLVTALLLKRKKWM